MFGLHSHPTELLPPLPAPLKRLLRLCDHVFDMKLPDQENPRWRLECVLCGHPSQGWTVGDVKPESSITT